MGLLDKIFGKDEREDITISDEDVRKEFRHACWDLYVSNLPEPNIVDSSKEGKEDTGEAVPRGFAINPNGWIINFNKNDLPKSISQEELQNYCRSIFHHELTHFSQVPSDALTEAILIDSALKGFKDQTVLNNKQIASAYSHLVMNVMGDLIGDTLLAKNKYGREDFHDLTIERTKKTIDYARETQQSPSTLWKVLISTYEKMWNEDLGLRKIVPNLEPDVQKASDELVRILGKDYRDRSTWENKINKFATVLEDVIKKTAKEAQNQQGKGNGKGGKGQGGGIPMPDDVNAQLDHTTESPLHGDHDHDKKNGGKEGKAGKNSGKDEKDGKGKGGKDKKDEDAGINAKPEQKEDQSPYTEDGIIDAIYDRNRESPGKFAGTLGALDKIEPDDALRFMYRARGRELLMTMEEIENQKAEKTPGYSTAWNVGDPLMGKGGLEIIPSIMASGRPVPGITTFKRKLLKAEGYGKLKSIPDLLIIIDSSGSMGWNPWNDDPNSRGDFDKAILAAEGGALYAIGNGGKVAVINFSGEGNITVQEYTTNLDKIERALMVNYAGGTVVPVKKVYEMIKKTRNPLLTTLTSDCEISNWKESFNDAFVHSISEYDNVAVFNIGNRNKQFTDLIVGRGGINYPVYTIEDLIGVNIGAVKKFFDESNEDKDAN